MDVSFVSIEHLLPSLDHLITDNNALICLIKPQFELGHLNLKNGIVKDKKLHMKVLNNVFEELKLYNLGIYKLIESPILGGSGNKEFLALIKRGINLNINLNSVLK
jgi:23S rRNA (cytidine1920-2'-O)/16S rRNA (cytidine1409-2'-O)-methyltransferase